jgi:hypothetical protein
MFAYVMAPFNDPLLAIALVAVCGLLLAIAAGGGSSRPRPRQVSRREIEARRRSTEEAIEEIGRRTREQIIAAAEQHRRQGSA